MDSVVELVELKGNQNSLNDKGPYNNNNNQQQQQSQQLPSSSQLQAAHVYLNKQQQPPTGIRYVGNQKVAHKHRELPVDVPDSFVGVAKQSPRYPPPKSHRQVSPPTIVSMTSNLTTFNHLTNQQQSNPATSYNNGLASAVSGNSNQQQQQHSSMNPLTQNTAANIMTHNSSLRSSIKLKQLEKPRNTNQLVNQSLQPAINQAFELNEDDAPIKSTAPMSPTTKNDIGQQMAQNHANNQVNSKQLNQQQSPDLTSIYNRLQRNLNGEFADLSGDAKLAKLLSIYNTIVQTRDRKFNLPSLVSRHANGREDVAYRVPDLLRSVITLLHKEEMTDDTVELLTILCKHEIDGACSAFDRIAQSFEYAQLSNPDSFEQPVVDMAVDNEKTQDHSQQVYQNNGNHVSGSSLHHAVQAYGQSMNGYEYNPDQVQMDMESNLFQTSLHPLTDIDLSDGTCTKTVRIQSCSNQALGATIKNVDGSVIIGRILVGGSAHRSGLLHEGDEILEVNGVQMRGKNINDVVDILEGMSDTLNFTIVTRNYNKPHPRGIIEKVFVKAFFCYDGPSDELMPCKELGLTFQKGDILAIIDQSDSIWWQAQREGDSEYRLAGLIPSINFLKQREKEISQNNFTAPYSKDEKKNILSKLWNCPRGTSKRRQKKRPNLLFGPEEIPYYEEVCLYYPASHRKRPIILVGPKMIGQREIQSKLMQFDPNRFALTIAHTSKPKADNERNGVDFHFVSRAQFEADSKAGKFIECGQFQNQWYGTSFDAVREVVKSKKTCLLHVNAPSILNFRQGRAGAELKPFFVFVRPDDSHPEKLRNLVSQFSPPKSNIEENIEAIMAEVQFIESRYSPYFEFTLTVTDVDSAYQKLLRQIDRIEVDPQWIPSFWQDSLSQVG